MIESALLPPHVRAVLPEHDMGSEADVLESAAPLDRTSPQKLVERRKRSVPTEGRRKNERGVESEGETHHSDEYSVPEMPKPRFEQYEAQTAGVMSLDAVEAEMRARPLVPSAIRLDEAGAKPAGRGPVEALPPAAADDDAAGAADDPVPVPVLEERSALSRFEL